MCLPVQAALTRMTSNTQTSFADRRVTAAVAEL